MAKKTLKRRRRQQAEMSPKMMKIWRNVTLVTRYRMLNNKAHSLFECDKHGFGDITYSILKHEWIWAIGYNQWRWLSRRLPGASPRLCSTFALSYLQMTHSYYKINWKIFFFNAQNLTFSSASILYFHILNWKSFQKKKKKLKINFNIFCRTWRWRYLSGGQICGGRTLRRGAASIWRSARADYVLYA